jgi:Met-zincin/Domain of unknown function (DUF5117)
MKCFAPLAVLACFVFLTPGVAYAVAPTPRPTASPTPRPAEAPQPYDTFIKDAVVQSGLIPIARKRGKVYLILAKDQLDADFIETSVPATGLGGFGPAPGEPYVAPARIMRFERVDDRVVMRWPNTYARVTPNTPQALAADASLPTSVIAVTPVVAEDEDGKVVIAADPFLQDVAYFSAVFDQQIPNPLHGYRLDTNRTLFTAAKAFPQNDILRVSQGWTSSNPDLIDNAPDARNIQVVITYNIIAAPQDKFVPRYSDPRVGYFSIPLLDFQNEKYPRNLYYAIRWNFAPQTPGRPSNATNPLVFYLSNNIPMQFRGTVRSALLQWNAAFRKIGILNAIQVQQQPNDPAWDEDDIRHNVVRWIDTTSVQFGAEALLVADPRTGEEINVGVNVDAIEGLSYRRYRYMVAPARGLPDSIALENDYNQKAIRAVILHESGHDLGLQHNFIGSTAYTAKNLQSRAFTSKYGTTNSVMEYAGLNLWPKGKPQGDYNMQVLGPYDYHAIKYAYAYIPNATTPESELPTLRRWASEWNTPMYRFASDEDTDFASGHAIDPRVQVNDLTNHPLAWCDTQITMLHGIMDRINQRFPAPGQSFDEARRAFQVPLTAYLTCAVIPAHTIGGEYLSRAAAGDPGARTPLQAVSRSEQYRAWQLLQSGLFSDAAWRFNPSVLNSLVYSEQSTFTNATWAYNPTPRHDMPVVEIAAQAQDVALDELFAPLTLERIDDSSTKYRDGATMSLTDLFNWSRAGIYGDIANGKVQNAGVVRRNLQMRFAKRLGQLWTAPAKGTPSDAQALARFQLTLLVDATAQGLRRGNLTDLTKAHLQALQAIAKQALEARATLATPGAR